MKNIVDIFFFISDAVVSQVLDELGLQLTDQLSGMYFEIYRSLNLLGSFVHNEELTLFGHLGGII